MEIAVMSSADINSRISEVAASGDPESIERESDEVVAVCARRYIEALVRERERSAARAVESKAKFADAANSAKAKLLEKTKQITTDLARSLHQEWTAALLAGEFALPDGSRVSWADATVEQHNERAAQLEAFASGDLATAAIHRQAVFALQTAGARCLGDLS